MAIAWSSSSCVITPRSPSCLPTRPSTYTAKSFSTSRSCAALLLNVIMTIPFSSCCACAARLGNAGRPASGLADAGRLSGILAPVKILRSLKRALKKRAGGPAFPAATNEAFYQHAASTQTDPRSPARG
ncbi:hypothetical protein BCEN4_250010 [Burkholderia cenocepacia]|nr:hypothetical protein BCEN4_250010 [Burkholderia cenocepacia]